MKPLVSAARSRATDRSFRNQFLALGLILLGSAPLARATSVIPPEFADLVNQSDFVVRAVVKSVTSDFAQPGSHKIITLVELDVRETIVGQPPQPLVLRLVGGKVGDVELVVEGAPQFAVGDEDILFVHGNGHQLYPLVALMHGVYPIERDAVSGRAFVTRSNRAPLQRAAEVALPMTARDATAAPAAARASATALTPEQFAQQIRAVAKTR